MKIACITEDNQTISLHFGRAPHYAVLTVQDGRIVNRELRDKYSHTQFAAEAHTETPGMRRGMDPGSHDKHVSMAEVIKDCEVLLCRGMGYGAYQSMQQVGITPMVTEVIEIDQAVQQYLAGDLKDHPEKLH